MSGWFDVAQQFESMFLAPFGFWGKLLSGGFSADWGDQLSNPFTGEYVVMYDSNTNTYDFSGTASPFTGDWTPTVMTLPPGWGNGVGTVSPPSPFDGQLAAPSYTVDSQAWNPFTTVGDEGPNAGTGEVVNPFDAPGDPDPSLLLADNSADNGKQKISKVLDYSSPLTPSTSDYPSPITWSAQVIIYATPQAPGPSSAAPPATAPTTSSGISTVVPPVASDFDPAIDRGGGPQLYVPPAVPSIETWPSAPLQGATTNIAPTDMSSPWFGDLTQTEWAIPAPDPRLIQPITHYDTGNQSLNFALNKVVFPWRNLLASFENVAIGSFLGLSDLDRDLKQNPSFGMDYRALQDMLPLDRAMGLPAEIGPALDYTTTWASTNFRALALGPNSPTWLLMGGMGGGGSLGNVTKLGPELESLGPGLDSALASGAQRLAENNTRGNAFQTVVTEFINQALKKDVRNTTTMLGQTVDGSWRATIVDVYGGGQLPMADVKDVLELSFTAQLQAQASIAEMTGTSFSVITSVRNVNVSPSLAQAVEESGGFVFRFDPSTMTADVWNSTDKTWIPFLGGIGQ